MTPMVVSVYRRQWVWWMTSQFKGASLYLSGIQIVRKAESSWALMTAVESSLKLAAPERRSPDRRRRRLVRPRYHSRSAAPTNRSPQEPIGRVYVRFSDWAARVVAGRQKTLPGLSNAEESLPLVRVARTNLCLLKPVVAIYDEATFAAIL